MWTCCGDGAGGHVAILLTSLCGLWLACTARSILWTTAIKAKIVVTAGSDSEPVLSLLLLYINKKKTVSDAGFGCRRSAVAVSGLSISQPVTAFDWGKPASNVFNYRVTHRSTENPFNAGKSAYHHSARPAYSARER